jgi:transcriptional regulator with XRE-family HTH domain
MMANETKTFGAMVAAIRKEQKLQQDEFARLVSKVHDKTVGFSTISRIEQGAVPVSLALGLSIIEALDPKPGQRSQLEQALDDYIDEFELPAPYKSGLVLDEIMEEIGSMTNLDLATRIDKSHQLIQAVRAGIKLLSDEALIAIQQELRKAKVPAERLQELTRLHIWDVLMTMPRLTYLTSAQREKLAACAKDLI